MTNYFPRHGAQLLRFSKTTGPLKNSNLLQQCQPEKWFVLVRMTNWKILQKISVVYKMKIANYYLVSSTIEYQ